ncbi:unnamed protein product [Effrenium voratum]|uniref:Uncharacterized protein n=1 Tax=Effrenium voratum TaxID=2562239 RepID=A0AA36MJ45_9DINO|nr:unnamed protein product [Effrenium voratum]CAJ1425306.1 unnamed protein product [Effrenium voratum]
MPVTRARFGCRAARPWWAELDPEDFPDLPPIPTYALEAGSELLWSLTIQVPFDTPKPRTNNVFRVRVMDPNKVAVDGNLWLPGEEAGAVRVRILMRSS